eukprot:m.142978 g.142978  ORF g.142978 m.142978 type:complete len:314 (-) comp17681_c0_seq1:1491-2432(-)
MVRTCMCVRVCVCVVCVCVLHRHWHKILPDHRRMWAPHYSLRPVCSSTTRACGTDGEFAVHTAALPFAAAGPDVVTAVPVRALRPVSRVRARRVLPSVVRCLRAMHGAALPLLLGLPIGRGMVRVWWGVWGGAVHRGRGRGSGWGRGWRGLLRRKLTPVNRIHVIGAGNHKCRKISRIANDGYDIVVRRRQQVVPVDFKQHVAHLQPVRPSRVLDAADANNAVRLALGGLDLDPKRPMLIARHRHRPHAIWRHGDRVCCPRRPRCRGFPRPARHARLQRIVGVPLLVHIVEVLLIDCPSQFGPDTRQLFFFSP